MYAQDRKYLNFKYFVKDSGSEGQRLTEAQAINKSLSNLGNVIMALAQKVTFLSHFQNFYAGIGQFTKINPQGSTSPFPRI